MTRFGTSIGRSVVAAAAAWWLVSGAPSLAANDIWKTAASGVWQTDTNWADNTSPGFFDSATFNLAGTYTVTISDNSPTISALTLTGAANVTFTNFNPTFPIWTEPGTDPGTECSPFYWSSPPRV
ncbi:MAG: hypothetical protein SH868_14265 [Bythopirellula sp.]|nr:hypothetical protein [Bythopirellula sp.]